MTRHGTFRFPIYSRHLSALCLAALMMPASYADSLKRPSLTALDQFSEAVQTLSAQIAPSVVQVLVTRYAPREESANGRTGFVLGRQQGVGSGVVVDSGGYIVTNAHVIAGAQRIRVSLVPAVPAAKGRNDIITAELAQMFVAPVEAQLVGVFKEADLALLKIAVSGLPALPFADYRKLRQGQVVFAFGSREGLSNSVSMGVVSSVIRQPNPDRSRLRISQCVNNKRADGIAATVANPSRRGPHR